MCFLIIFFRRHVAWHIAIAMATAAAGRAKLVLKPQIFDPRKRYGICDVTVTCSTNYKFNQNMNLNISEHKITYIYIYSVYIFYNIDNILF